MPTLCDSRVGGGEDRRRWCGCRQSRCLIVESLVDLILRVPEEEQAQFLAHTLSALGDLFLQKSGLRRRRLRIDTLAGGGGPPVSRSRRSGSAKERTFVSDPGHSRGGGRCRTMRAGCGTVAYRGGQYDSHVSRPAHRKARDHQGA